MGGMTEMTVKCPLKMTSFSDKVILSKEWMEDTVPEIGDAIRKMILKCLQKK